jgi:hypothetical protein
MIFVLSLVLFMLFYLVFDSSFMTVSFFEANSTTCSNFVNAELGLSRTISMKDEKKNGYFLIFIILL